MCFSSFAENPILRVDVTVLAWYFSFGDLLKGERMQFWSWVSCFDGNDVEGEEKGVFFDGFLKFFRFCCSIAKVLGI